MKDLEVYHPPPAETLKDEGNALFSSKRYAKAIQKCVLFPRS